MTQQSPLRRIQGNGDVPFQAYGTSVNSLAERRLSRFGGGNFTATAREATGRGQQLGIEAVCEFLSLYVVTKKTATSEEQDQQHQAPKSEAGSQLTAYRQLI
ncbi:MAG: hypothetical protein IMF13_04530 [Proteobacteria bacterium]|nr:hypothetical protein [Pseudomonadota bacterium]